MNEKEFEYLGIKKWHDAGILGQGITVASIENGVTTHSKMVLDILHQILPEATILTSIKYWKDVPELDGYTCSQTRADSNNKDRVKKQKELYDRNVFMTCAVGNEDDYDFNDLAKYDEWVSVGACFYKNGKLEPAYYSSETEYLDFCEITNLMTNEGRFTGSSCATPVLQGMAMLVQCYEKIKYNRKLSNKELYNYIVGHCIDIGEDGFDNKCGNGLFILPDIGVNDMEIVLRIGDKKAFVNGKPVELDVAPKIENGRTLVPIRFISECMNMDVQWDVLERSITIKN